MSAIEIELKGGLLWGKFAQYKKQEQVAFASLRRFFSMCENPYLALSWGKQSIVLAHMIWQIRPETPMIFLRSWESYLLHDFERVIASFCERWPINWIDHYRDNVSGNNLSWKETRDLGQNDIQEMAERAIPDWDGVIMGLSKDESKARRITTSLNTTEWRTIFRYTTGKFRCTPIQAWKQNDLAAYIANNEIPLLSAYRDGLSARTTARITRNQADSNGMKDLKNRDMTAYNIIVSRFPELSAK